MKKSNISSATQITACIKPNSRRESIEWSEITNTACIRVNASPVDQKANSRVFEFLSEVLRVPKSKISIVKGFACKIKVIEIKGDLSEEQIKDIIKNFTVKK